MRTYFRHFLMPLEAVVMGSVVSTMGEGQPCPLHSFYARILTGNR